jgi:Universal stress protein UspA and related nucleotide-binding proteins
MQKLLLAYDGTEHSRRALELAAVLTHKFGASLTVVSVVPTRPGRAPIDPWDDTEVHTQELLEAGRLLREEGIEARLVETAGDVPGRIERIATDGGFDAVIVGSRGLSMLGRALQGSVSEHVAANADTTVIVAR